MELTTKLSLAEIRGAAGSGANYLKGEDYFQRNKVVDVSLWRKPDEEQLSALVKGSAKFPYATRVYILESGDIEDFDCTCPAFREDHPCKHIVALLLYRYAHREEKDYDSMAGPGPFDDEDYSPGFRENIYEPVRQADWQYGSRGRGVDTDPHIKALINRYARDDLARAAAENNVRVVPRLELYEGAAFLSITMGSTRQYIVKNLESFCRSMKIRETLKYGKELELIHHIDSFEPASKELVRFIMREQTEKGSYSSFGGSEFRGYGYPYSDYRPEQEKRNLKLTPSAMDELFDLLTGKEFMIGGDRRFSKTVDETPPFSLALQELPERRGFSLMLPDCDFIFGSQHIYLYFGEFSAFGRAHGLSGNALYRCGREFSLRMKELLSAGLASRRKFTISEQDMTSFCVNVLSELPSTVKIEGDISRLNEFTPEEVQVKIYLDSPLANAVTAVVKYQYGETEIDPYDRSQQVFDTIARDEKGERRAQLAIKKYFKSYDMGQKFLFIQGEDDLLYDFLTEGFDEISRLGQVFVSDRFKNMSVKRPPQIAVGVRMESDLLHIELDTKELPLDEAMDALNQYRQKRKYYRMKDGSFLNLDDAGFAELSELVEGLGLSGQDLSKAEITVPKYRALYLDHLLKGSDHVTFERNGHFKSLVKNMKAIGDSEFAVPETLESIMRSYQKDGYRWLATMDSYGFGGILADDMGLGKTLQIISLLLSKKEEGQDCSALVVCPASLVLNWQNEIQKFAPRLNVAAVIGSLAERGALLREMDDYDVIITSYDLLKRDIDRYRKKAFRYHIVDEAQYIKNQGTQNAKAVKAVVSRQRFALTGTPIENRLSELWSIFDFLMPDYLFGYKRFKDVYETDIVKSRDKRKIEMLGRQIAPFLLRRLKANVLRELPEKVESVVYARMEGEQKKLYHANLAKAKSDIREKIMENGFETNKIMILALLTRLRQICCHPSLCYEDYKGGSAKLETCTELLLEAVSSGHKVLLFSQFTTMLGIIENRLKKEGLSYYMLTGATEKSKRMEMVDNFNEDETRVFLISLKAGGTGLNLTGADVVIHYDPWWNVAAQNQATDRTHRIGQKNSVQVYKLIEKGTLEEKILKLQESKRELADSVVNDELRGFQALTQEALMELLEP